MLFPLISMVLFFGGTFILLSKLMLFSVQVVVASAAGQRSETAESGD